MTEDQMEKHGGFKFRYVLLLIILLLFILSLSSHNAADLAVLEGGSTDPVKNLIGPLGAQLSRILLYAFGLAIYPIASFLLLCLARGFMPYPLERRGYIGALVAVILGVTILMAMWPEDMVKWTDHLGIGHLGAPKLALSGGVIGAMLASPGTEYLAPGLIRRFIGTVGTLIAALTLLLSGLFFIFMADWKSILLSKFDFKLSVKRKEQETDEPDEEQMRERSAEAERFRKDDEARIAPFDQTPDIAAQLPEQEELPPEPAPKHVEPQPVSLPEEQEENRPPWKEDKPSAEPEPAPREEVKPEPRREIAPAVHTHTAEPVPLTNGRNGSNQQSPVSAAQTVANTQGPTVQEEYRLPPVNLFDKPKPGQTGEDEAHLQETQERLQGTLDNFGVAGRVSEIVVGPRVTRFEITLDPGVKVEKVTALQKNIAMDLKAESLRILAPVPGKNAVGVEVPNKVSTNVYIRSILETEEWKNAKATASNIPIILGRDVAGRAVIANLAKAPHLLIAGSTGSGKSVCMNTLIMSLLMKFSPYDLRLILVDPKHVELAMYRPIPHLITPVVNDPKLVPLALRWGDNEMERRYRQLAAVKAKNLEGFNSRPLSQTPEFDEDGNPIPHKLPLLVIIIDELADIMMTEAKSDVETYICRIAQKGRAAGIHLVIATQTPRKDIITGLIKANLPTKIAFRVTSGIDSRVILDTMGAENLLGKGDMLFLAPGGEGLERVQGTMVADPEIQRVSDFVSVQVEQKFDSKVVAEAEIKEGEDTVKERPPVVIKGMDYDRAARNAEEDDEEHESSLKSVTPAMSRSIAAKFIQPGDSDYMRRALEIIVEEKRVSTSYIQRRLGIGYNKSAELIDQLEKRGIVSPPLAGGQKRDILILDQLIETNQI